MRQQSGNGNEAVYESGYNAWLSYPQLPQGAVREQYTKWCGAVSVTEEHDTVQAALHEWQRGIASLLDLEAVSAPQPEGFKVAFGTFGGGMS